MYLPLVENEYEPLLRALNGFHTWNCGPSYPNLKLCLPFSQLKFSVSW